MFFFACKQGSRDQKRQSFAQSACVFVGPGSLETRPLIKLALPEHLPIRVKYFPPFLGIINQISLFQ